MNLTYLPVFVVHMRWAHPGALVHEFRSTFRPRRPLVMDALDTALARLAERDAAARERAHTDA